MEIHDHAGDMKAVQVIGDRSAVEFEVTDGTMNEFLEAAEEVHKLYPRAHGRHERPV